MSDKLYDRAMAMRAANRTNARLGDEVARRVNLVRKPFRNLLIA